MTRVLAVAGFALLVLAGAVRAEPAVRVTGEQPDVAMVPRTILFDPDGALSPTEAARRLAAPDARVERATFSHGFTPDVTWARIVLDVEPAAAGRWFFTLELPNFDRLQVYEIPGPGSAPRLLFTLGDRLPAVTDIRTRFHLAPLELSAGRTVLLVRGKTNSTTTLALRLWQLDALLQQEQNFFGLQCFYLGIGVLLLLGSLGVFAFTGQLIYLVYIVNLIAHWGIWLMVNGIGPGYLWPDLADRFTFEVHAMLGLSAFGVYTFSAMFLSTVRVPRVVPAALWVGAGIGAALAILCFVTPEQYAIWTNRLVGDVAIPLSAFLLIPTAVALFFGEPAARPLLLTWIALNAAAFAGVARNLGLLPNNVLTLSGPQVGSLIEMLIFAWMLVSRLGNIQRDALAAARRHKAELEQRVADRTAELDAAVVRERRARQLQQQFVAMVSHEFRTPLAVIDGSAQNIAVDEPAGRERVGNIRMAVRRLLRMIDTCLIDERVDNGRIELRTETFDLRELLKEAVDSVREAAPDHRIETRLPDEPVMIEADLRLTEIAINNLLENAVKYTPPGSTVEASLAEDGAAARLVVQDDGPGVAETDRERIFEKYARVGNDSGAAGSGLGLHLVRAIAEAHGGSVGYMAAGRPGGRFVLRLPLEEDVPIMVKT